VRRQKETGWKERRKKNLLGRGGGKGHKYKGIKARVDRRKKSPINSKMKSDTTTRKEGFVWGGGREKGENEGIRRTQRSASGLEEARRNLIGGSAGLSKQYVRVRGMGVGQRHT